jgi:hypothetical protein
MNQALVLKAVIGASFTAVLIGAFLPWSESGPFTETGVEGNGVATVVLAAAGIMAVVVGRRPRAVLIATSAALVSLLICLIDFADVSSGRSNVGAGLYIGLAGSVVAVLASGGLTFSILRRPDA